MADGVIDNAKNKRKAQLSRTERALRELESGSSSESKKADNAAIRARIEQLLKSQAEQAKAGNKNAAKLLGMKLAKEREKLQ